MWLVLLGCTTQNSLARCAGGLHADSAYLGETPRNARFRTPAMAHMYCTDSQVAECVTC